MVRRTMVWERQDGEAGVWVQFYRQSDLPVTLEDARTVIEAATLSRSANQVLTTFNGRVRVVVPEGQEKDGSPRRIITTWRSDVPQETVQLMAAQVSHVVA